MSVVDKFVKSYVSNKSEILGVLLVGSSTIGVFDRFTDFDLMAFTDDQSLKKRKMTGKGYNEVYHIGGIDIGVDWHNIQTVEQMIKDQKEDWYLWIISNSKILYDPLGKLREAIDNLRPYSFELQGRKSFKHYYWLRAKVNNLIKCVARGEYEAAFILCCQALDHLTQLLFLIEGKYVPYEKWRFYEMRRQHVGESYLAEIRQILCTFSLEEDELLKRVRIFERIIRSISEKLVKLGIPDEWVGKEWWRHEPDWDA